METIETHPQYEAAAKITAKLRENGHEALFAGGCVRDGILKRQAKDLDVATSATPDQVEELFEKTVAVGKSFGVIRVLLDGQDLEVATFRKDGSYADGRRPDSVEFSSRKEDAQRRDFTINALFFNDQTKEVFDDVGGIPDLEAHLIRAVGNPEKRFEEDHLRLLRAARFAAELDFLIENDTWKAMCLCADLIETVSGERIKDEISKLVHGQAIQRGLETLFQSGLLAHLLKNERINWIPPSPLLQGPGTERWWFFWRWLMQVDPALQSKEQIEGLWDRWRFSKADKTKFSQLLETTFSENWVTERKGKVLERYFLPEFRLGLKLSLRTAKLTEEQMKRAEWLEARYQELKALPQPLIQSADLIAHKQGPELGTALKNSFWLQLEEPQMSKDEILRKVVP